MKSSDVCIKTTYNRCPVMNEKELEALLEEATKTDKNLARLFNGKMTVSRNPAEKRIKADKKDCGVQCEMSRSNQFYIMLSLLNEGAISMEDLEDFSDDLKEIMQHFSGL